MGGALVVIVLVVFFATIAINMAPAYVTFMQVRSVIDGLHDKPEVVAAGRAKILRNIDSQLNIEGIRSVGTKDFQVAKGSDGLEVSVDYEVRKHLFFNVDVVMHFAHTTLLPGR
jgi:hypothetical protein